MRLDTSTTLPNGLHVRVRLPHASDRPGLHALHARLGVAAEELDLARALRFDPRTRVVVCATAFLDGAERHLAYAGMEVGAERPDLLVADETSAPGIGATLERALGGHAARRAA